MTGQTHARSNPQPPRLLRLREVLALTGISRSEIYRRMANRTFPQAVKLGERIVAWSAAEVADWVEQQLAARSPQRA